MADDVDIGLKVHTEGDRLAEQLAKDLQAVRNSLFSLTTAARANAQAMSQQGNTLQAQLKALNTIASQNQKTLAGTAKATDTLSTSVAGLVKQIAAAAVAFAGFQGFKAFIAEGLEFNKTIETANLGIASLISAQTEMRNNQGELITGVDKLRVAQELATDQVNKLRIAGLQTTATTQELVVAFQQAVGVGLRWGLTLDQIRTLTIQMSQAAGALGLPMNQLNEEVRDLLGGNINARNTRIATALGITNEQIRQAQKAGQLFDFVTTKLEAFSVAGEATARTFSGVMSNVREALQNLAGDATKPLFDELKNTGIKTLEEIFDMKNARISTKFAGILDVAKQVFGGLGDLLADAIDASIAGAKEFNDWLVANRVEVQKIFEGVKEIGTEVGFLVKDAINLLIPLGDAGVKTGFFKTVLVGAGLVVAEIHTAMQGLLIILSKIGILVLTGLIAPFGGWLRIIARAAAIFNDELGASIDNAATKGEEFVLGLQAGLDQYTQNLKESGTATDQYLKRIDDLDARAEKFATAQNRRTADLNRARDAEISQIAALDAQLRSHAITQQKYNDEVTKVKLDSVNKQIAAEKAYFAQLDQSNRRERERTLTTIKELQARAAAIKQQPTLKSTASPEQKDSAAKVEQGETLLIKAELAKRLADLKSALDQGLLSYHEYYDKVRDAQSKAIDAEIAALEKLRKTQQGGAAEKTTDQIKALMIKRNQIITEETDKERKAYQDLGAEVTKAHVELLRDQGRLVDAAQLETFQKFRDLIKRLKAEVKAGTPGAADQLGIVEKLFGIEQAKVKLEELTRRAKEIQDTLATQLSEINTESTSKAITEQQAREKIVTAYKNARDQLAQMIPLMREQAALTGDPNAIDAVEQLNIKLKQMDINIQTIGDSLQKLKVGAKESIEQGLGQFIDDAFKGAKSLHDAWKEAAQGIVDALRRIASQMLANLIIQKTLELFGFAGGGLVGGGSSNLTGRLLSGGPASGGPVTAASGGYISGPGGPTEDRIPAWLSAGEYVVKASAVRTVGLDFLNDVNSMGGANVRGRHRARGYAEGGLVTETSNQPGTLDARLTVGFEEGLVLRHMESSEGQRVQLRTIEKNRNAVSSSLRK